MCGVYLNRGRIVLTFMLIPLFVLLIYTEQFFGFLGFDPVASRHSQIYIYYLLPSLYFMGMIDSNRRFLVNMGYATVPMFIQICVALLHIFWCYLLTDFYELGIKGTAISSSISNLTCLIAITIYSAYFTDKRLRNEAWFSPFSKVGRKECFDS